MFSFEWEPLVGVGKFKFGDEISLHKQYIQRVKEEEGDSTGWNVHTIPGIDIRIYDEDGKIVSISCFGGFIYKSRNLIGSPIKEAINLFGVKPEPYIDEYEIGEHIQKVYEFESIGLQIWAINDSIVTIIATGRVENGLDDEIV